MSGMSRLKGRNAEREVEAIFRDHGLRTERTLGGRHQAYGDILCEGLAVEVRRRERLTIEPWLAQHVEHCPPHFVPVVVARRNRGTWMAALELLDFCELVREGRS